LHPVAQGSDGGGSVRIPAACCGLVGIKPSRGRITRAPQDGESWGGLSTTGPIARTVRDAALMLDAMAGMMPGDPYSARPHTRPFVEEVSAHPRKLRLAFIDKSALGTVDDETLAGLESACAVLREMGHSIEPIALDPGEMLSKYARVIVGASVSALNIPNPDLLDPVVRGSYEWGAKISAADYIRAVTGMHNTSREIIHTLMPYDALIAPTLTRPAVRIGTLASNPATGADEIYRWIAFTFPFNSTGQPAISVPNGFSKSGLPLALQIVGRPGDEAGVIALAAEFERAHPWKDKHPEI
jgi:amidase